MSEKISEYTTSVTALASGDLMDVSKLISTSPDVYQSQKLNYSVLLTELNNDLGFINGSGTANYISKFSASGTLANSSIQDNGAILSINNVLDGQYKLYINSDKLVGLGVFSNAASGGNNFGISGSATNANTASNVGVFGNALLSSGGTNLGVRGQSASQSITDSTSIVAAGSNVGGFFQANKASGISYGLVATADATINQPSATFTGAYIRADNAGTKYSVRLVDGSEGTGKFLKSVTSIGQANWASLAISDITASLGTSLQVVRVNAGATALEYATLSLSNLGSANLTSTDDARTFTLKSGTTATQNLQFLNSAGKKGFYFDGEGRVGVLTSSFNAVSGGTSNLNFGDSTNQVIMGIHLHNVTAAGFNAYRIFNGANVMQNISTGGDIKWFNQQNNANTDVTFSLSGGTPKIQTNTDFGAARMGYGHYCIGVIQTLIGTDNNGNGYITVHKFDGTINNVISGRRAHEATWFGEGIVLGGARARSATPFFDVMGAGATSATTTALFQNSASVSALKVKDDGYCILKANNAAIASGDLGNNEMSFYIDEGTNHCVVKVKYSSGTVKTGTFNLT